MYVFKKNSLKQKNFSLCWVYFHWRRNLKGTSAVYTSFKYIYIYCFILLPTNLFKCIFMLNSHEDITRSLQKDQDKAAFLCFHILPSKQTEKFPRRPLHHSLSWAFLGNPCCFYGCWKKILLTDNSYFIYFRVRSIPRVCRLCSCSSCWSTL